MNHHLDTVHQGDQASRPFLLFFDLTKVRLTKKWIKPKDTVEKKICFVSLIKKMKAKDREEKS